jgi:hypothetical protein
LLEDSIERVLEVFQTDALGEAESDSLEGDFEGLDDGVPITVCISKHTLRLECSIYLIYQSYETLTIQGFEWLKQENRGHVVYLLEAIAISDSKSTGFFRSGSSTIGTIGINDKFK